MNHGKTARPCAAWLTIPDRSPRRHRPLVSLFEGSGLVNYDIPGADIRQASGRARVFVKPATDVVTTAPSDMGELHERYGRRIHYQLRTSGVRDVEDAYSALLERMLIRGLLEAYEPRRGDFIKYMDGFVHWQIRGRLKEQRRRDRRESPAEVPDRPADEQGYLEVEFFLCLDELASTTPLGGILLHCAAIAESTGTVTGVLLGRRMAVSPQMARRHLARLRSAGDLWGQVLSGGRDDSSPGRPSDQGLETSPRPPPRRESARGS